MIDPSAHYACILEGLPEDLGRKVFTILSGHVGQDRAITREALATQALGEFTATTDRQVREVIEELRRKRVPVLSSSGRAGYWLAKDRADVDGCIADLYARYHSIEETIRQLRQARVPAEMAEGERARQERLWA
jgi:hypothetical protein